jgi:hypothetical protein
VCSAFERGDHHLNQGAATKIGYTDCRSRRQVVTEEIGPGQIHLLLLDVLILILGHGRMEAPDAEIADPGLGATAGDQFRHHGAGAGAELEAMQRKAELVIEP